MEDSKSKLKLILLSSICIFSLVGFIYFSTIYGIAMSSEIVFSSVLAWSVLTLKVLFLCGTKKQFENINIHNTQILEDDLYKKHLTNTSLSLEQYHQNQENQSCKSIYSDKFDITVKRFDFNSSINSDNNISQIKDYPE